MKRKKRNKKRRELTKRLKGYAKVNKITEFRMRHYKIYKRLGSPARKVWDKVAFLQSLDFLKKWYKDIK